MSIIIGYTCKPIRIVSYAERLYCFFILLYVVYIWLNHKELPTKEKKRTVNWLRQGIYNLCSEINSQVLQINFIYTRIDGKFPKRNSLNRAHPCLFCHCHGFQADISAYEYPVKNILIFKALEAFPVSYSKA